jgi:hypothetical protein
MEEHGKKGGSAPLGAAEREVGERRDDKPLLDKPLRELGVE